MKEPGQKVQKIKHELYKQFMEKNIIQFVEETDVQKALDQNVTGKHTEEARAMIIIMYYTGARPNEILELKAKDVIHDKSYIKVWLKESKGGLPRTIWLQLKRPMVKEFFNYARKIYDEMFLFSSFRGMYIRTKQCRNGVRTYIETTDKLRYHFKKWFKNFHEDGIPPYYLRHNRFSKVSAKGGSAEEIRQLKGAKTFSSVVPYLHMSSKMGKSIAKKIE